MPIFEDDCYADLIWDGRRPPALYAMSKRGGVIHIGSFSKSIAPALRVGYIVAPLGDALAHAAAQDRCRLGRAGADGAGRILQQPHFNEHVPKLTARPARQARDADGGARRAIRHRGRVRGPQGGIFLWVKLPDAVDTLKLCAARAGERRRDQSGAGMVDRQEPQQEPDAALLRQSLARGDPRGRRRAGRGLPARVRRAGADCQCGAARPGLGHTGQPACSSISTSAPRKSPGWMNAMRSPATLCCGLPPPSTRTPSCARQRTVCSTSSTPRQK